MIEKNRIPFLSVNQFPLHYIKFFINLLEFSVENCIPVVHVNITYYGKFI